MTISTDTQTNFMTAVKENTTTDHSQTKAYHAMIDFPDTATAATNQSPNATPAYVTWFRNFAPYINTHRGKTFVIMFNGEAVQHDNFSHLIHDLALLHSLGIKLVLVHGARPQIDANLAQSHIQTPMAEEIGRAHV